MISDSAEDVEGNHSAECDIIVKDRNSPPLYLGDTYELVPVEGAYGVIEVKSNLDTRELKGAQAKIARAKLLNKTAYVPQSGDIVHSMNVYGRKYDHTPIYGMIFAYTSMDLVKIGATLRDLQKDLDIEHWVDAVVVLDSGMLMYTDPATAKLGVRPVPGSALLAVRSDSPLVPAVLCVQTAFNGILLRPFKLGAYMGDEPWGVVEQIP